MVFDVGANIGGYVRLLRSAGFKGPVVSFEPRAEAHAKLLEVAQRDRELVVPPPMALGKTAGDTQINIAGRLASSSLRQMTRLHEEAEPASKYVGTETIRVERLDTVFNEYIGEASRPFLKLDVQGFEIEVLEGASASLDRFVGIQAELSLDELYRGQMLWLDFAEKLGQQGFRLVALFPVFLDDRTGHLLQADGVFFRQLPS